MADELFCNGRHEEAIAFYNRVAFFNDSLQIYCLHRIALSNFYLGKQEEAERTFEFASQAPGNDSIRTVIIMDKAVLYLTIGRYDLSQVEIQALDIDENSAFWVQHRMLTGLSLFGQRQYAESGIVLKEILPSAVHYKLDSLVLKAIKWDKKKEGMAFLFSLLIPGSGQLLFGNANEALKSVTVNGGFATLMYFVYTEYGLIDASLSVLPWFMRYYLGGAFRAEKLAIDKKQEMHEKIFREVVVLTENNQIYCCSPVED